MSGTSASAGWLVSGFQAQVGLWCWTVLVVLYGLFRSVGRGEPDEIRESGPGV